MKTNIIPISAKDFVNEKLKSAIQSTGRLGFTEVTAKHMKLTKESYILFSRDKDNENILYVFVHEGRNDDGFKVRKSGDYFSVDTKLLFDSLGYDYLRYSIIFDMIFDKEIDGYKLIRRQKAKKAK